MKSNTLSDLVVLDFIDVLAKLSLSQYIASGRGPSLEQVRKYCSRNGRGGYGFEATRWDNVGILETARADRDSK